MTQTSLLPALRTGTSASAELAMRRSFAGSMPNPHQFDDRVALLDHAYGGVRCVILTPPDAVGTLVYFHGGGFRLGSPDRSAHFASKLAQEAGCRIVLPQYGLAPENPFPAALHEGDAVLRTLAKSGEMIIGGDSAGGNLATVLACRHAKAFGRSLRGLLLFSPWVDLTASAASYQTKGATDTLFSHRSASEAASLYLQGYAADDELVSPLFGDLTALPSTFIIVGSAEVLLDDSLALASKLAAANRAVALHAIPNMQHVAATLDPNLEGAAQSFKLAAAFLRSRFRPEP